MVAPIFQTFAGLGDWFRQSLRLLQRHLKRVICERKLAVVCKSYAVLMTVAASVLSTPIVQAQDTAPAVFKPTQYDLVINGLDRPARLRLTITANGLPWSLHVDNAQRRYQQAVFAQLDRDRDNALSAEEAKGVPPPRSWASLSTDLEVFVAFNFRALDADGDGKASAAEFEQYSRAFIGAATPMQKVNISTGQSTDDLFRVLDVNRDRALQAEEWSNVAKFMDRDRDGNRVLTLDELRGPSPVAMPPEFVASLTGVKTALKTWQLELQPSDNTVQPVAEVMVEYVDDAQQPQRPRLRFTTAKSAEECQFKVGDRSPIDLELHIAGHRLVLRIPPPPLRLSNALQQQLRSEFDSVADKTEAIVSATATMPHLLKSILHIADRNADGKLELTELEAYSRDLLPLQVAADSGKLRLVDSGERTGLMPLADQNLDSRLSRRELQSLPRRLSALAAGAAKLNRDAIPPTTVLILQHGPLSDVANQTSLEDTGPPWFYRADRNQDGDLDQEEFLGLGEDFQRLDTNKDGWIDLNEAILGDPATPPSESSPNAAEKTRGETK